ncbi:tetratricopeptide repeat-containing sulfotransferase family protein [Tychonema sp. LEGE 07203]|uniref:tetratricopeptide repeat-containing sulfotransferase family protein n=1 Tax=Tychonema sp. LEGE 07203 TaxID=1828671 RepID=UPI001880A3DE|nr:tetratricopeptide repeat-containing sulfotransferase family protein [Tychonema sp. LEGE 07203]MBE9097328.1 tetratricopeptide repeat protein [Tychonema sp. LEGE 07203]
MDNDYHDLGNSLQSSGRFDDAVAAYRKAVELNPDFSWSYHGLGDVLLKLEQWEDAVCAYKKAVELNPDFSWSYHNLGDALLKLRRWEEAAAAYKKAVELNSDFAWSFCNLGDALTQLKYWDEAIAAYLKAVKIDGNLPGIYEKLGFVLGQTEFDLQSVLEKCKLQVTAENHGFYLDLGKNLAKFHRPKSAIIFYQLLLTYAPSCAELSAELDELLQQQEKYDRTLASARATVAQKPDDCWSYYNLGAVLSQQKYGEEAAAAFLQAIHINPDIPWWFYYNLWEVFVRQNKLDEVENFCREVVTAQPEAFWPYLNLGEVLTRQGKIAEAICCYQTVSYKQSLASILSKRTGKMPVPQADKGKMPAAQNWNLKLVKVPNFIIIGSQRCGTTSLYTYLAQHPQVLTPIKKEMDFFSWHFYRGFDWYLAHFPQIPEGGEFVTGEASPSYFDCREAPKRLYSACPEAKLIVLLRNPADRAISHFYRLKGLNWEGRSLDRAIKDEIERLNQNPEYIIGEEPGNYLARGRYIEFMKNWLALFPKQQLLILKSEDFYAGAAASVKQVLEFLELPEYQLPEYQNANPGFYPRVNESVRELLNDYFKPYNQELEEYLGRKFGW